MASKMGTSKHIVALDDGPRREKICLRRKGNGKLPWLHKSVMATAYRRKRDGLTHREPWSQNSRTLSRALTSAEANTMWSSFDAGLNEDHDLFRLMDADGNVTPRSNAVDDSDPSKPMGLRLQSGAARHSPCSAVAEPPVKLGQMRSRQMSQSAPQIGASTSWGDTQPAVVVGSDIHVRVPARCKSVVAQFTECCRSPVGSRERSGKWRRGWDSIVTCVSACVAPTGSGSPGTVSAASLTYVTNASRTLAGLSSHR